MEQRIKKIYNLKSLKQLWVDIEKLDDYDGVMSFDYICGMWKYYFPHIFRRKHIPVFYILVRENRHLIIPLCKQSDGSFVSFGFYNYTPYNFVGHDVTLFSDFVKQIGGIIFLNHVKKDSNLYGFLSNHSYICKEDIFLGYKIIIKDYDSYFNGLHKSTRQNVRTAYNRLNRDNGIKYRIIILRNNGSDFEVFKAQSYNSERVYTATKLDESEKHRLKTSMIEVYVNRLERYHVHKGRLRKWLLKNTNPIIRNSENVDSSLRLILEINGSVASAMIGFISTKEVSFYVPLLTTNVEFGFYSPGIILVNEAIRYLLNNTNVKEIDLGIGDEPYKKQMGGVEYALSNLVVNTDKCI